MRRKIIQDFANTLCQMLVGWRMTEDFEVLAELPDGTLTIDALTGAGSHDVIGPLDLHIAGELQAWLLHRLGISGIPVESISSAIVVARVRTDRVATVRKRVVSFDFAVQSTISTGDHRYEGQLHETHHWHSRVPSNYSLKRTAQSLRD